MLTCGPCDCAATANIVVCLWNCSTASDRYSDRAEKSLWELFWLQRTRHTDIFPSNIIFSKQPVSPSIYRSTSQSIHRSVHLTIHLNIWLTFIHPYIHVNIHRIRPSIRAGSCSPLGEPQLPPAAFRHVLMVSLKYTGFSGSPEMHTHTHTHLHTHQTLHKIACISAAVIYAMPLPHSLASPFLLVFTHHFFNEILISTST